MRGYEDCSTCEFANRNEYGIFESKCSGFGNCSYEKYHGDVGRKLNLISLYDLGFGSFIRVVWGRGEEYKGVIYGDNIGYEDGKTEKISVIAEHMDRGLCTVYLIGEF